MTAKFQLALDTTSIKKANNLAAELIDFWDILEIGTSLLITEGLDCVTDFRNQYRDAEILVDTKIIDNGSQITSAACRAGGNIVTVVSAASNQTILECVKTAHEKNGRVLLDHIAENWSGVDLLEKSRLGVDLVGLHLPKDVQSMGSIQRSEIETAIKEIDIPIAIAGGINPKIIRDLNGLNIDVFIVGGYLLNAADRIRNAKNLRLALEDL